MRFQLGPLLLAALFLAATANAASAERLYTLWKLEPITPEGKQTVALDALLVEERLLPASLVELTEDIFVDRGKKTLPAGTQLYLVFNATGTIAYCTMKDWSGGNQLKTLFIPALDTRPCLLDTDGDDRFDKAFFVFDKFGSVPTARGDSDSAKPVKPGGYARIPQHRYANDMRLHFKIEGSALKNLEMKVESVNAGKGQWAAVRGLDTPMGRLLGAMNVRALVDAVDGDMASATVFYDPNANYVRSDEFELQISGVPDFVRLEIGRTPATAQQPSAPPVEAASTPSAEEPEPSNGEPPASPETSGPSEIQP